MQNKNLCINAAMEAAKERGFMSALIEGKRRTTLLCVRNDACKDWTPVAIVMAGGFVNQYHFERGLELYA